MTQKWHVIRSKPNKEFFLANQLEQRNCDVYFPILKVKPINPRCRTIIPYFPGYLFINTDLEQISFVVFERLPGSIGLVFLGGEIANVPEKTVESIQSRIDDIENHKARPVYDKGDKVSISSGIFAGYEAMFDLQIPGTDRAKILLTMLRGTQIKVELPVGNFCKQL